MGFTAIVLAPIAEEALFRGVIYTALKQRGYRWLALWGNAALFAFIHFNLAAMVPLFFLALVWTWLYERTGNLLASIAGHMVFNAVNFALLTTKLPAWLEKAVNP
jgi:membrane protease YdiL (CAAX protease family)